MFRGQLQRTSTVYVSCVVVKTVPCTSAVRACVCVCVCVYIYIYIYISVCLSNWSVRPQCITMCPVQLFKKKKCVQCKPQCITVCLVQLQCTAWACRREQLQRLRAACAAVHRVQNECA